MNLRAVYPIYRRPVKLERVIDGLWTILVTEPRGEIEAEFFESADIFKEPMSKARSKAEPDRIVDAKRRVAS
jgi:hypothetical protein